MASDYQLEDTLYLPFTTRAYATGIPTVLASGQVDIYEDATATPIITSETFVSDLNSVAGLNMVTITATAATGFGTGQHYSVVLGAGTVDSVSVIGEVVATFTLEMSAAERIASDTHSLLVVVDAEVTVVSDQVASVLADTTPLEDFASDTYSILADATIGLAALETIGSDTEARVVLVQAQVATVESEVSAILVDTAPLEDFASDTYSILADATVGLNALETITSNTHSLLTLVEVIASDAESNVVVVAANLLLALSDTSDTLSRLTVLDSEISQIHSETTIMQSSVSQILSDTTRLEVAQVVISGLVEGAPSTTVIPTDAIEATDAHYANMTFMLTTGDEHGESRRISAYSGATGQFTLDTALSGTPSVGEAFVVINNVTTAGSLSTKQDSDLTEIASNLIEVQSDVIVIDQDTSDLKSDLIVVDQDTSDLKVLADATASEVSAILVDTSTTLENRQATIASDLLLVLSDTSDTLSNTVVIASQVLITQSEVSNILSDTTRLELTQVVLTGVLEATISTTVLPTDATEATDDQYNNMQFVLTNGTGIGQARRISNYAGATGTFTVDTAFVGGTPSVGDTFAVLAITQASGVLTAKQDSDITEIASNLIEVQSDVILVDQDTSDLKSALLLVKSDASDVLSNSVVIASNIVLIESSVSNILSDTLVLESSVSNILSDTLVLESSISQILSDTTRMELGLIVITGLAEGTPTSTVIATDATEGSDDHYNNMTFIMTSGNETGEARRITNYTGASGTFTVDPALSGAPSATETFVILPIVEAGGSLTATQDSALIRAQSDTIRILSDTTIIHSDTIRIESDTTKMDLAFITATGTVENSGSNSATQVQTTLSEATDNHYNNNTTIVFTDGLEAGQARVIDDYDGALGIVFWTEALTGTPADSVGFSLIPSSSVIATLATGSIKASTFAAGALDASAASSDFIAEVADGVWDEPTAGHVTAGTTGLQIGTDIDAILSDSTVIEQVTSDIESNVSDIHLLLDTEVSDILSRVILIVSDTSDAVSALVKVKSHISAVDSALTVVDDLIDGEVADIQARLPAALSSGNIKADILAVNTSTAAAAAIALSGAQIIEGIVDTTATATSTTTFETDTAPLTAQVDDFYIGRVIIFTTASASIAGQATDITDYATNGGRGVFTFDALTTAPSNNDEFVIV